MLEHAATVRLEHFNYNGNRERLEALLNGDIAVGSADFAAAKGYIDENRLKARGISTTERNPLHPDVPTPREQGVDVAFSTDRGVLVPEGHSRSAHTATGDDLRALGRNWYTIGW